MFLREFWFMRPFFETRGVFLIVKAVSQHCNVAEKAIQTVKRRIYMRLRLEKTLNWVKMLQSTVHNINRQPNPSIGI